jgi:hypothetical protein
VIKLRTKRGRDKCSRVARNVSTMGRAPPSLHEIPRLVQAAHTPAPRPPPPPLLRRDRGSFCQPTATPAQKVVRPLASPRRLAATAENYPRNLQPPFFQAPADSACSATVHAAPTPSTARRKMKVNPEARSYSARYCSRVPRVAVFLIIEQPSGEACFGVFHARPPRA